MVTRKESSERFNQKLREEWVKSRAKQIMQEDPLTDPRMSWDQASSEWEQKAEYEARAAQREELTRQAVQRSQQQRTEAIKLNQQQQAEEDRRKARTLAVNLAAQQKNLEPYSGDIFRDPATGEYYEITGTPPNREARKITAAQAVQQKKINAQRQATAKKVEESLLNNRREKLENIEKYIKDTQSLLFNKMTTAGFSEEDKFPIFGNQKVYRVQQRKNREPTFIQDLCTRGLFSSKRGSFLQATPAQLASLVPILRFYIIDEEGNENEIYFSDKVSSEHLKKIAELKGKSIDEIINYNPQGGGETGITSFSWHYNNKHEGDYIIEADLELYFGSLVELANVEYLKFLGATGNVTDIAESLTRNSIAAREKNVGGRNEKRKRKKYIEELSDRIDEYQKVLKEGNAGLRALAKEVEPRKRESTRELKVVVGWSLPEGNDEQLRSLFSGEDRGIDLKSFREEVKKTQTSIFLNLVDYNVEFTQEGPTTLSLKYVGSSDNFLATDKSDTFGSNNFESDILYVPTEISLEGILEKNNKLSDSKNDAGVTTSGGSSINPDKLKFEDPYLNKLISGKATYNRFGERTAVVQLAGLRYAQELVSLKIKFLEASQKVDPEDPKFKKLRVLGQYIVLLYNRALRIRLRDMYSEFLKSMIEQKIIKIAVVEVEDKGDNVEVNLKIDPQVVAKRKTVKDATEVGNSAIEAIAGFAGKLFPEQLEQIKKYAASGIATIANIEESDISLNVYYFFLGDLISIMAKNAGLSDRISFLLGNFDDISDNSVSIYKIPITLESFADFFYNRVVAQKVTAYPFRTFFNDFLNYVARMMNENSDTADRISFEYTMFPSYYRNVVPGRNKIIDSRQIRNIRKGVHDPLSNTRGKKKYQSYYAVFARRQSIGKRNGNIDQDQQDGIFHYALGSDRGLAKNYNFSRQDTQFFQEMLIESNNPSDKIQALFLPQNVEIEMYGNGIHRNGDMVYVDTRAALGEFASQVLGIGGYYRVVRATHQISNRGYTTNLSCVFELRAGRKKSRNEPPARREN